MSCINDAKPDFHYITTGLNTFVQEYQNIFLIDYSKVQFSNCHILDKHHQIFEDIFEEFTDFEQLKLSFLSSKTVIKIQDVNDSILI